MAFKVLIACLKNWDACAETPFLLKKAGCTVDVFCSGKSWLISNSHYNHWYESPDDLNQYRIELAEVVRQNAYDWVILADDALIRYMNEFVEEHNFEAIMPIQQISNREMLSSKKGFSTFCKKYDIDTP